MSRRAESLNIIASPNENLANARRLKLFRRMSELNIQSVHFVGVPNLLAQLRLQRARENVDERYSPFLVNRERERQIEKERKEREGEIESFSFRLYAPPSLSYLSSGCGVLIFNSCPEGTYSLQSVWPSPALPPVYTPGCLSTIYM